MRMNLSKYLLLALTLFMTVSCAQDSLDNYKPQGAKPSLSTVSVTLENGYTLVIDGVLESDGGSPLMDLGICYNIVEDGEPSLNNPNSKIYRSSELSVQRFSIRRGLAPNKEYQVRIYAQNRNGVTYGEVQTVTTPDVNIDQLLTGTYIVKSHQSYYFMDAPYGDYEVNIVKGPVFMGVPTYKMEGLKVRPGVTEKSFTAEFEVIEQVTDSGTFYNVIFPAQLTGITLDKPSERVNVMMINGRWLAYGNELETDIYGTIDASNGFDIVIPRGYAFVCSDIFTDEIKGSADDIVDLILGPITFDEGVDTDYRAECRIIKKY